MRTRSVAILVAGLSLIAAGCATKKFVREEVGKSEAKLGADVGRVEGSPLRGASAKTAPSPTRWDRRRSRSSRLTCRATEATNLARTAQGRADEGVTKAGQAQARADEAHASAGQANGQGGRDRRAADPALGEPQQAGARRDGRHPLPASTARTSTTAARRRCSS